MINIYLKYKELIFMDMTDLKHIFGVEHPGIGQEDEDKCPA